MTDRPTLRVVGPAPTEDDRDVNPELVAALLALLAQAEAGEIQALAYATDDDEDIVWGVAHARGRWRGVGAGAAARCRRGGGVMQRQRLAFLPDTHVPFADHQALAECFDVLDWWQPDAIFHVGDLLDCYTISTHPKTRTVASLQAEIDEAVAILAELRHRHPRARIELLEGNHEARLRKLITNQAPGLASLDGLTWPQILQLERLRVGWTEYPTPLRPFGDGFVVVHGDVARNGYPAATPVAYLRKRFCSGVSGHTHRMGWVCRQQDRKTVWWAEIGHLTTPAVCAEYAVEPDWQQGFAIGTREPDGTLFLWLVPLHREAGETKPRAMVPGWL